MLCFRTILTLCNEDAVCLKYYLDTFYT